MTNQKISNAWSKYLNPLRDLNQWTIRRMFENLRFGNDVRLQIAEYEMERVAPIFGVCINKRLAGIMKRQWKINPLDESSKAKTQAEFVQKVFDKSDTLNKFGLTMALRHLGLASFRGRSVIKPFVDKDGLHFRKIQNWNTLEWNDKLYWNPDANEYCMWLDGKDPGLQELTEDEVIWVSEERPIDLPGIEIYLRQLVGEENWARATEKYGVAQIVLKAPDGMPDNQLDVLAQRAVALFEGGSGVLTPGTDVQQLTDARGQDPFTEYIKHQEETIVLLACGEKLTTLGGTTGLGSNLADVQSQEFQNLVTYDCKKIQNAITRCAVAKVCKEMLNEDPFCKFEFIEDDDNTAAQYIDLATKLKDLGAVIDVQELKKLTKLSFIKDEAENVWAPSSEAE